MVIKLAKKNKTKRVRHKPLAYTAEGKPIYGYNAEGKGVCYKLKKNKEHCMSRRTMPNGRCRKHGGKNPSGQLAPTYKTGEYSKYRTFPNGTADRIREIISNPKYLSLSEDIAFYDLRIEELGSQLAGLDKANVGKLFGLVEELETALEKDDDKRIKKWLEKLIREVKRCLKKYDKHQELTAVHRMRKELAEAEANITQKQDIQLPATRAVAIFDRQNEIVIEEAERWIADSTLRRNLLLSIAERMNKLLPGVAPQQVLPSGNTDETNTDIR